jgi:lipopolysaccharide heptosyltransferase II
MTAPTGARAAAWAGVRRVLAIRPDNLGDVLMTTPALAACAESVTGVEISLLGSPSGAAVAPHLGMVNDVIAARVPWVRHEAGVVVDDSALIADLAARRFDAAVIFTVCTQSALPAALLCRLAGIPLRLAHCRENPYDLLSDWVPETDLVMDSIRHEVRRQLDLVAHVGWHTRDERLRFTLRPQDQASLQRCLRERGLAPRPRVAGTGAPLVVVHVGASAPSRRYPAEQFGLAADAIAEATGARVVFTGSADEAPLIDAARDCMTGPSVSLAGALGLGELAALIGQAQLLVSNNSGPVHLAAALGTPVIDLYAQTNPQHTPWQVDARVLQHDVPCRHCLKSRCPAGHHDCLRRVPPQAVASAALELLGAGWPAPEPARRAIPLRHTMEASS